MIAGVQNGINDPTVLSTDILAAINKKNKNIASQVRLPDLIESNGVVIFNAGAHWANMPSDYDPKHGILYAYSLTNELELEVRSNSKALYKERDRTTTGSITEVAADGTTIFCWDGTTAKDKVRVKHYRIPDDLRYTSSVVNDIPDYVPLDLQEPLYVDGTVFDFLRFKRYTEGQKLEAQRDKEIMKMCGANYAAAYAELKDKFKDAPKARFNPRRKVSTF